MYSGYSPLVEPVPDARAAREPANDERWHITDPITLLDFESNFIRVPTLATEAVALASGADRRAAAVSGLLLAGLPALAYALALGLPALMFRNRRAMRAG